MCRSRSSIFVGKNGSVPVLLMVLLASMLLAVGVITEAASAAAAVSYEESIAELAGRSVLSMYDRNLLNEYGLFGRVGSKEEVEEELSFYISSSLKPENEKQEGTHADINGMGISLDELSLSMDDFALTNTEQMEKQIRRFMKYRVIGDLTFDQNSQDRDQQTEGEIKRITEASDMLTKMDGDRKLIQKSQRLFEQADDLLRETLELKPRWEQWKRAAENGESERAERLKDEVSKRWRSICHQMGKTGKKMENLRLTLEADQSDMGKQLRRELSEAAEDMKRRATVPWERLDELFGELEAGNRSAILERFRLRGLIHKYQKEGTAVGTGSGGIAEKKDRELKNKRSISQLPSVLLTDERNVSVFSFASGSTTWENLQQRLYTASYVMEKCGNKLRPKGEDRSFFQNEAEYVLVGTFSDRKNAKTVKAELYALRETANLIHIYLDQSKREEIRSMAAALTPGPAVVLTEFLITMVWSCAESKYDVDHLLDGGRVPLLKSRDQWKLSLNSAIEGSSSAGTEEEKENGFTYEQYLRLFLFLQPRDIQLYRLMDLIQLTMQGIYDKHFQMQNCFGGFYGELTYSKNVCFGLGKEREVPTRKMVICHEY